MDIILDSNIYLGDVRMRGTQFAELFAYLRRTKSRLVLVALVLDEVLARYEGELQGLASTAKQGWSELQKKISARVKFPDFDISNEVRMLRQRLLKPADGFEVKNYSDTSGVDVGEVAKRGINRIRPASVKGEELRDVILWLTVLHYAKNVQTDVVFISQDNGFREEEGDFLHRVLQQDVLNAGIDLSFYRDIGHFIAANSPPKTAITQSWFEKHVSQEDIKKSAEERLAGLRPQSGTLKEANIATLNFVSGQRYKVAPNSFYVEARYEGAGTMKVQEVRSSDLTEYFKFVPALTRIGLLSGEASKIQSLPVPPSVDEKIFNMVRNPQARKIGESLFSYYYDEPPRADLSTQREYKCRFALELSARIEDDKTTGWQIDTFQLEIFS